MASITNESGGRRTIQFVAPDGSRKSVRLGKVSKQHAELAKVRIERLIAARLIGEPPDPDTRKWLYNVDPILLDRLARAGLVEASHSTRLGDLGSAYLGRRSDLKPQTRRFLRLAMDRLTEHFGHDRLARTLTTADAADWRRHLLASGLSEATARTYARGVKQVFRDAMERELLEANPFAKLPSGTVANTNERIVTRAEITRVLDACPDQSWRTLIALCRFGGLRCPSETHLITWSDVDLKDGRMLVRSPKTEHHLGHDAREVPIQPALLAELQAQRADKDHGRCVIPLSRNNLHRRLTFIIAEAGVDPWRDPFHCLRRSCQTEWAEDFPEHVVASWIGNSVVVARRHYLKVTEEHFHAAKGAGR